MSKWALRRVGGKRQGEPYEWVLMQHDVQVDGFEFWTDIATITRKEDAVTILAKMREDEV